MTEQEQQLQNYAAEVEKLRTERTQCMERLRVAIENIQEREGKIKALQDVIDRLIDKLADR